MKESVAEKLRLAWEAGKEAGAQPRDEFINHLREENTAALRAHVKLQNDLLELFELGPTDQPDSLMIDRIRQKLKVQRTEAWNARGHEDIRMIDAELAAQMGVTAS